jgi:hypothetical protein
MTFEYNEVGINGSGKSRNHCLITHAITSGPDATIGVSPASNFHSIKQTLNEQQPDMKGDVVKDQLV